MVTPKKLVQGAILAVALAVSVMLVVGIWKGKRQKHHEMVSAVTDTSSAEMKLTDMDYTEMQNGRRAWTLHAAEAKYYQNQQKTALQSVRLVFFLKNGDKIHLQSRQGILYAGTKDIELWGAVHAELPHGYQLATQRAVYRHKQKVIVSQTPITITGPDLRLVGNHWKFLIPEQRALLGGKVRATVEPGPVRRN